MEYAAHRILELLFSSDKTAETHTQPATSRGLFNTLITHHCPVYRMTLCNQKKRITKTR